MLSVSKRLSIDWKWPRHREHHGRHPSPFRLTIVRTFGAGCFRRLSSSRSDWCPCAWSVTESRQRVLMMGCYCKVAVYRNFVGTAKAIVTKIFHPGKDTFLLPPPFSYAYRIPLITLSLIINSLIPVHLPPPPYLPMSVSRFILRTPVSSFTVLSETPLSLH